MRQISSPLRLLAIIFIFIVLALSPLAASAESRPLYMPMLQSGDSAEARLTLVNPTVEPVTVKLIARSYGGAMLQGSGIINPVSITMPPSNSRVLLAKEIFGYGVSSGWVELQADSPSVTGAFFLSDPSGAALDGADFSTMPADRVI